MITEGIDNMIGVKLNMQEVASESKVENANSNSSSSFNKKLLVEDISEFSDFGEYRKVCVPVSCGQRVGIVCTFAHKDNLDSKYDSFYLAGLKNLIEYKKYIESEKLHFDVGPAYAIATAIEDGDYSNFLLQFQSVMKINDFELVFQVKENGDTYHILPANCDLAFGNITQLSLIKFSILKAFDIDFLKERSKINNIIIDWLTSNNSENPKKLREILNSAKKNKFINIDREFKNCIIYDNLFDKIKTYFELNNLVEKLQSYAPNTSDSSVSKKE